MIINTISVEQFSAIKPNLETRGRKADPNKPVKVAGKRGRPKLAPELRKPKPVRNGKRGRPVGTKNKTEKMN